VWRVILLEFSVLLNWHFSMGNPSLKAISPNIRFGISSVLLVQQEVCEFLIYENATVSASLTQSQFIRVYE
jgi:hypothetical protein